MARGNMKHGRTRTLPDSGSSSRGLWIGRTTRCACTSTEQNNRSTASRTHIPRSMSTPTTCGSARVRKVSPSTARSKASSMTSGSTAARFRIEEILDLFQAPQDSLPHASVSHLPNFGHILVGMSASQVLTFRNLGVGTLAVSQIGSSNPSFSVSDTTLSIFGNDSAIVTITYTPQVAGVDTGLIYFCHQRFRIHGAPGSRFREPGLSRTEHRSLRVSRISLQTRGSRCVSPGTEVRMTPRRFAARRFLRCLARESRTGSLRGTSSPRFPPSASMSTD